MPAISMKQLLEAGVHFGHQTRRWNPKMKKYIFTERNGIYIIDLQKTVKKVDEAYNFVKELAANGGQMLFVGTKKQAQEAMKEDAERIEMFYVNHRWLGGTLTNFATIQKRVQQLKNIEKMEEDGTFEVLPKKEVGQLKKEKERLEKFLGGIKNMKAIPDAMFIVDPRKERIAVAEARKLNIPIVAMCDTNCDPDEIDYVIPSNDDAIRAVKLISSRLADAVIEGKQGESYSSTDEMTAETTAPQEKVAPVEPVGEVSEVVEEALAKAASGRKTQVEAEVVQVESSEVAETEVEKPAKAKKSAKAKVAEEVDAAEVKTKKVAKAKKEVEEDAAETVEEKPAKKASKAKAKVEEVEEEVLEN